VHAKIVPFKAGNPAMLPLNTPTGMVNPIREQETAILRLTLLGRTEMHAESAHIVVTR